MRSTLRNSLLFALAAVWAVTILLWVRSYWRVDKVWVQVLPQVAVEARLTPGRIVIGSSHTTAGLPTGDAYWFTWPVEAYFAEFIPPPENPLFCQLRIYNGAVTIPLWFLALLAALPNAIVLFAGLARSPLAGSLANIRRQRSPAPAKVTGVYLQPKRPLIAVGPAGADAQSGSAMHAAS